MTRNDIKKQKKRIRKIADDCFVVEVKIGGMWREFMGGVHPTKNKADQFLKEVNS